MLRWNETSPRPTGDKVPVNAAEIADLFTRLCPLRLVTAKELLPAALELAGNLELTVYDSFYLSLALLTETSLVTADRHLKKDACKHRLHRIVTLLIKRSKAE